MTRLGEIGELVNQTSLRSLKTAFVPRPLEYGPGAKIDLTHDPPFDVIATDFNDLAAQLGT
jgi:hypothetical protein